MAGRGPSGGPFEAGDGAAAARRGGFAAGAALSLSNPQNVSFWAALAAPMAALGVAGMWTAEAAVFLGGFTAASVVWCFAAAAIVAWRRTALTPTLHRVLNLGCAVARTAFGLVALWGAAHSVEGG